jgi:hypothetical protein
MYSDLPERYDLYLDWAPNCWGLPCTLDDCLAVVSQ